MVINTLEIVNFRNIATAQVALSPTINVFCGDNGSGKTSLLEAVFLLTHGRSFRTRKIDRVIRHHCQQLVVRGQVITTSMPQQSLVMATERTLDGKARFKMANEYLNSPAALTRHHPILLINPDSYRILELGPKYRRQFLDWGLFHVEQSFYGLWQRYNRILKQRNNGLRQRIPKMSLKAWDPEFIEVARAIDTLRQGYLDAYEQQLQSMLALLLPEHRLTLHYQRGWAQKSDLTELLEQALMRDYEMGYTSFGPHRADLFIKSGAHQAHEVLSRGQQKLLIFALRLAQGLLLQRTGHKNCSYLVDDLPAELDRAHQRLVMNILCEQGFQVLLTGVDYTPFEELLRNTSYKVFHVEQGEIKKWYNTPSFEQVCESPL